MTIKKLANRFGYDIKHYHSTYDDVLKKFQIETVFDIGANTGQFARSTFERLGAINLYSFEPIKDCFDTLVKDTYAPDGGQFQAFNFGLGDVNTKTQINHNAFSPSSSLLEMTDAHKKSYPKASNFTVEGITLKRLDDTANDLPISGNLMIKMDVQGFEDKVIAGGMNTISKAKVLLIETSFVRLYKNQPLFGDIFELVRKLGFEYHGNNGAHYDKNTGELLFEDSIFIRY